MSGNSALSELLKRKLPDSSEIELHLFEFCNLRCTFCGQDHDDRTGMLQIRDKAARVIEFIRANRAHSHIINIMGGEIFNDEIPDGLFDEYFAMAEEVDRAAREAGHACTFNWVTNLVFEKRDRVEAFLGRLDAAGIRANLSTSYDFHGRKSKLWLAGLFQRNIEYFRDRIYTVGFVLTKPTIAFLLTQKDEYFEHLYLNFPIYFDYYVPEAGAGALMPSDHDILQAYLFIARNYPKISPVAELLQNRENRMTCYSLNKLTLLPDGREVKCRYLDYKPNDFRTPLDYSTNEPIIWSHLQENGCLGCEWYDRCGFRCFVQADWSKRVKTEECLFREFFRKTVGKEGGDGAHHQAH